MTFFAGVNTQTDSFEMSGGDGFEPIPKDTRVVAICEEAKNDQYEGERYINLKWRINAPKEYNNRVIFQKLKVYTDAKAERARSMLAAVAFNAGNKLNQAMAAANENEPSDASLQTITNSPMVLLLDVWTLDDKSKSGNWVKAVSKYERTNTNSAPAPAAQPTATNTSVSFDDIPF